jgi:hypothetical protein
VSPGFDEELIHKMRTTVKKMRALADWTGSSRKNIFRKYYKTAGNIRNVQLLLKKIKGGEYNVPGPFTVWLERMLHQLKVEWQKKYDKDEIKTQLKELKKTIHVQQHKSNSMKFAVKKNDKIISLKNVRPLSDDQIHSGRKTLKEIDYLNKWENKNSDEGMKKLSEETGQFMDSISAIKLLEQYIEQEKNETDRNAANELLAKWKKDKEGEKIKLLNSIDSLPA